jgi:hypothetical protein
MNNTEPWWYRVLANSSPSLFWGLMGMGLGACLSVFAGAVNTGGEILKIYLGIVTVIVGSTLGIYGSRSIDRFNDRRVLRRKANVVYLRIRSLKLRLAMMSMLVDKEAPSIGIGLGRKAIDDLLTVIKDNERLLGMHLDINSSVVSNRMMLVAAEFARREAVVALDFDGLLDTEDDVNNATVAAGTFEGAARLFRDVENDESHAALIRLLVAEKSRIPIVERMIGVLDSAEDYFKRRAHAI